MGDLKDRIARLREELDALETAEADAATSADMNVWIRQEAARPVLPGREAIARRLGLIEEDEE